MNFKNYNTRELSIEECQSIVGGDFWGDLGYGVGKTFAYFANAFEAAIDFVKEVL